MNAPDTYIKRQGEIEDRLDAIAQALARHTPLQAHWSNVGDLEYIAGQLQKVADFLERGMWDNRLDAYIENKDEEHVRILHARGW